MGNGKNDTQGYAAFLKANEGRSLSKFEYLYMVMRTSAISNDFYIFFSKLFCPTVVVKGEGYFIEENFDSDRYQECIDQGQTSSEIAGWLNLVEITALFEDMSYEGACALSVIISDCWSVTLAREFPASGFISKVLFEDELGEVYVTLCKA
ncbi:hypothetical protein [Pseudomonas batumici]|uniref:hypothetical protein n=1 Tax=Pseudomonas batumici TaxID=226910 RepID=UPI000589C6FA|nr:hypothetical protein [Pseudomonas batumici]